MVPGRAGIELVTPGSAVRHASVARHVTDCVHRPGKCCISMSQIDFGDEKIFFSETTRPRAMIFGMLHHLVDLYQVCSNYATGVKKWASLGITFYIDLYRENMKNFLSEATNTTALIFGM